MKRLRYLRFLLHRQVKLLQEGKPAGAEKLGISIENLIADLEARPPQGPEEKISEIHADCHNLNELALEHFEAEKKLTERGIWEFSLSRQLKQLRRERET